MGTLTLDGNKLYLSKNLKLTAFLNPVISVTTAYKGKRQTVNDHQEEEFTFYT